MEILVLGVGQSLRGDDAAGLEAVRRWREKYSETAARPGVRTETSELPGLGLLDLIEGSDAVLLVDAVHASAPAGALHRLDPDNLAAFTLGAGSAHGWGVAESLQLGLSVNPSLANCRIILLGIEVGQVEIGASLSPQVEAAMETAVEAIEQEIHKLG